MCVDRDERERRDSREQSPRRRNSRERSPVGDRERERDRSGERGYERSRDGDRDRRCASAFGILFPCLTPTRDDRRHAPSEPAQNDGRNIYVASLDPRTRDNDLRPLFDRYGEVESCTIVMDPHTRALRFPPYSITLC